VFNDVNGMPLHPLIVHLAVVGIPLAFLLTVLFAVPRTRAWARWPLALTVLGSTAVVWAARQSGAALQASRKIVPGTPSGDLIQRHSLLAGQLFLIMLGFSVVTLLAIFLVGRRQTATGDEGGTTSHSGSGRRPLNLILLLLLIVVAAVALVWTARVGDLGSRAAWNPNSTGLFPF
jgi:uncharacterized membrane protein